MAATSDEEEAKQKLLQLNQQQQPNVDVTGGQAVQSGFGEQLLKLLTQQRQESMAPNAALNVVQAMQGGASAGDALRPTAATAPAEGQSDLSAFLHFMSQQQKGFDPVAAQREIRNTPVADYNAQQQIAASQAAGAGLAATAAEDAAANRATAKNTFAEQFPGQTPPALGETISKMLSGNQGALTAFPSGGYAVGRSPKEQLALQEARRRTYAERGSLKPTGPRLTYGSSGYSSY